MNAPDSGASDQGTPIVTTPNVVPGRNVAPARRRRARTASPSWSARLWLAYVLCIYAYLYGCMLLGGPFFAFDHQNYINFLNEPFPFFFEPGYTALAFVVNDLVEEEARFAAVFVALTLPPLWIVWRGMRREGDNGRGVMVFACILTKSFYIGYIAQRFFFAELWVCALLVAPPRRWRGPGSLVVPSLLHFSALAVLPGLLWLRTRLNWRKTLIALAALLAAYVYIKLLSGFQLFGYDYSRYLDPDDDVGGFPAMALMQTAVLAAVCQVALAKPDRSNLLGLTALVFMVKVGSPGTELEFAL